MNKRFVKDHGLAAARPGPGRHPAPALSAGRSKMIQVKGSDTMVNLVQILAEEYMAKNPKHPDRRPRRRLRDGHHRP